MKLENYEVHLPSYSIGNTIYDKIGPVCESYGRKVLVIGGRKALAAAYDKIVSYVEQTNLESLARRFTARIAPMPPWNACGPCPSIRRRTWCLVWAAARPWTR